MQVKTYELLISGIFHLVFLDGGLWQVTVTKPQIRGRLLYNVKEIYLSTGYT
jgi:hypothetical protein